MIRTVRVGQLCAGDVCAAEVCTVAAAPSASQNAAATIAIPRCTMVSPDWSGIAEAAGAGAPARNKAPRAWCHKTGARRNATGIRPLERETRRSRFSNREAAASPGR